MSQLMDLRTPRAPPRRLRLLRTCLFCRVPLQTGGTHCQPFRNQWDPRRIEQFPQVCLFSLQFSCLNHLLPRGPQRSHPLSGNRPRQPSRHPHRIHSLQCSGRSLISGRQISLVLLMIAAPHPRPCRQTLMLPCLEPAQAPPSPQRIHLLMLQWNPLMPRQFLSTMTMIPVYAVYVSTKCRTGSE